MREKEVDTMERRFVREKTTDVKKNPAKKMAKGMSKFAFFTGLIVIAIIFVFYQHKNREDVGKNEKVATTEIEKLSTKDLETGYPETPVEVMKLYGRMNQYIYNTKGLDDKEFDTLLNQLRMFYSAPLLQQNPVEEQKELLRAEAQSFIEKKRRIANYTVDKSSSVKYKEINGQECAYIQMAYFMNEKGDYTKSFQDYVLVKENNKWKILAFKKNTDNSTTENEES